MIFMFVVRVQAWVVQLVVSRERSQGDCGPGLPESSRWTKMEISYLVRHNIITLTISLIDFKYTLTNQIV